jgi:glycosyltransferase involved in cell wall biosynthesis
MNKKCILIIDNSIAVTGALQSIVRSSNYLRDQYNFVFILPVGSSGNNLVKASGFEVYYLPMKEIRKNIVSLIVYIPFLFYNTFKLLRLVRILKVNSIVANDFYNLIPALYKALGGKVTYTCYVRFLPSKFPQYLVKIWCALHEKYASSIVSVSEAVKRELPVSKKLIVIGNELPVSQVRNVQPSQFRILYPANFIKGKGQEYALQAFALVHKRHPAWSLRFVGGDMGLKKNLEFKNLLIQSAVDLGLKEKTEWKEYSDDIFKEYEEASMVLNFSESESFSLTCLEAMYFGRALIATACGGPSEIIDSNVSGILVPVKDISAMASALSLLLADADLREQLGKEAAKCVREKYSYKNTVERLRLVYQSVV